MVMSLSQIKSHLFWTYLPYHGPWRDILPITNLMILHLTFISTVSIAVTCTLCPKTHHFLTAETTP